MAEIYHVTADKCLEFSGLKCDARLRAKPFILFSCVCVVKLLAAVASELVLCVSKSRWVLIFQPPLNIYANKIISVAIVCWDVLTLLAVVVFAYTSLFWCVNFEIA